MRRQSGKSQHGRYASFDLSDYARQGTPKCHAICGRNIHTSAVAQPRRAQDAGVYWYDNKSLMVGGFCRFSPTDSPESKWWILQQAALILLIFWMDMSYACIPSLTV
jgi:hypothetical protein